MAFFSVYWFFIALLPVSNIYPISDSYMAERWLYLPSLGLIILLGAKLKALLERKNLKPYVISLCVFVILFFSCLTIKQNEYWKEPVAFYKKTLEYNPENWKMYNQLALQYSKLGNIPAAEDAYNKALKIKPYEINIYYNLLLLYKDAGEYEKAAVVYLKTEQLKKKLFLKYVELGDKCSGLGKNKEAAAAYTKALELTPGDTK